MTNDLMDELSVYRKQLDKSILQLRKTGAAAAKAEKEYKTQLRLEILKLRDEGTAVGIIEKICYGIPSIAELRFTRDMTKITYEANQEAINSLKLQIRILDNQIAREWSNEVSS